MTVVVAGLNDAVRRAHYNLAAQQADPRQRYDALLCIPLRLVFVAHAERSGLLPLRQRSYASDYGLLQLWTQLRKRAKNHDDLRHSYAGWPRLRRLFAAIHGGLKSHRLQLPARGGVLFSPQTCAAVDGSLAPPPHHNRWFDDACLLQTLNALLPLDDADDERPLDVRDIGSVYESAMGGLLVWDDASDGWTSEHGHARRSTGSHYTPTSLTRPLVTQALKPLLRCMPKRTPQRLLALKVCDPAMGSGAFLVETCLQLGALLAHAWQQQPNAPTQGLTQEETVRYARRLVAARCLYGVDKNALAVELAKLSLWLVTAAADQPFTFLDHALVQGDSLIGLTRAQLEQLHWRVPSAATNAAAPCAPALDAVMAQAARKRRKVQALSAGAEPLLQSARLRLIAKAAAITSGARAVADAVLHSFFHQPTARARNRALKQLRPASYAPSQAPAVGPSSASHSPPVVAGALHWPLVFPEAFIDVTHSPPQRRGMDIVIGNPPFLGGKRISTEHGRTFAAWLRAMHGSTKNVDLSAHFLRRGSALLGADGTIAMITTNTLPQGATRRDGLRALLAAKMQLYYAVRTRSWPGDAAVQISICCLARGEAAAAMVNDATLNGERVSNINSLLRQGPELGEPQRLLSNQGRCFIGCFLRGKGFVLSDTEGRQLQRLPHHHQVVRRFLGGEEVNHSPTQQPRRYVIDFNTRTHAQAQQYAQAYHLVAMRVKPVRERLASDGINGRHKAQWWQFACPRPALRAALKPLSRCLVAPRVTKHLCFVFQPTDRIFSDQLCVFAADDYATFALLQSRIHDAWVRRYASTLVKGLRYTPTDCVDTFAHPSGFARSSPTLASIGERLYHARAKLLIARSQGLTKLYNALHDPAQRDSQLVQLRALHTQLDEAVLSSYGWHHITVPAYDEGSRDRPLLRDYYQTLVEHLHRLNGVQAARAQTAYGSNKK